jgi:hypothetical protein
MEELVIDGIERVFQVLGEVKTSYSTLKMVSMHSMFNQHALPEEAHS